MEKDIGLFENWPYRVPKLEAVKKKMAAIIEELEGAVDGPSALKAFRKMSKLQDKLTDEVSYIQVLFTLETTNKKYVKSMNKLNEILPLMEVEKQRFCRAFVNSKHREYLEKKLGSFIFQMYEFSLRSFDEKIVPEAQQENELVMKYDAAVASCKVPFHGQTYNVPQMGKFLSDKDRSLRKEASEALYSYLDTRKEEFEGYYDELVKVRTKMAHKLGYKSYTELGYIRMSRFDYNEEMVAKYRESIHQFVTPLVAKLIKERMKRLGIKNPALYDLNVHFKNGNPLPFGTTEEKVEAAKKMYAALSEETSYYFNFMVDHHLLFLDAKEGKQSGGYMTQFPLHKCPIIFSNFNGTSGDVDVLTHEFGHSFQYFMAKDFKVPEYRMPTSESCEIDSMSMEFFAEPYMDLFFEEADKYRYVHLASSIEFLPYGVTVDEFQHWVYANPEATPAERNAKWHELELKYTPWKVEMSKDIPYMYGGHRWLLQSHIFSMPFYYIDYTLAQVLAFEFFNLDRKDHKKAWKKYLKLCKMGGKYPFCELVRRTGLKCPFDEGVLEKTIKPLSKVLKSYHPERF